MTRDTLIEHARREAGRYKTSSAEFVAWTRVEVLVQEESPVEEVALRFLEEIGRVLGRHVAEMTRRHVRLATSARAAGAAEARG